MTPDDRFDEAGGDTSELADELRRVADDVLAKEWSTTDARQILEGDRLSFADALWSTLVELGWATILDAPDDPASPGENELCALTESLGRALTVLPLAGVCAAGSMTGGDMSKSLVVPVEGAVASIDHGRISGSWPSVPFGAVAEAVVVAAHDEHGQFLIVEVPTTLVDRSDLRPLDRSPDAAVTLDAVAVSAVTLVAEGPKAQQRFERATRAVQLARIAELVGVASGANAAAVEYAKERVAYGRPIGTYQAIKHRLVDQRADVEVGRALVGRAARAARAGDDDADALTSLAAFWAIDRLRAVTEGALQVFGGIGYTWEHDAHLYLRRAACLTSAIGARHEHREVAARWLVDRRSST